ncbi:MAG: GGDEF domain-containing protein [Hyphomicrobium sp.]
MIAAVQAEFTAVQVRAIVASAAAVPLAILCSIVLWRRLNASLTRSEGAHLEVENKIRTLAMNDVLTGLANRMSLREALADAIARAEAEKTKLAVLMIDLDRFKPINDRHGHLIGDLVLKQVAKRLANVLRNDEFCGATGGDEFVAIVEYPEDDSVPTRVGLRLIEALCEPMTFDGLTVEIGASVGIAVFPTDAGGGEELIRKADTRALSRQGRGARRCPHLQPRHG